MQGRDEPFTSPQLVDLLPERAQFGQPSVDLLLAGLEHVQLMACGRDLIRHRHQLVRTSLDVCRHRRSRLGRGQQAGNLVPQAAELRQCVVEEDDRLDGADWAGVAVRGRLLDGSQCPLTGPAQGLQLIAGLRPGRIRIPRNRDIVRHEMPPLGPPPRSARSLPGRDRADWAARFHGGKYLLTVRYDPKGERDGAARQLSQ